MNGKKQKRLLFTSESVTEGHPDKVCDYIADSILDAVITLDPKARVACEVCATTDFVLIMGEIATSAEVDFATSDIDLIAITRKAILEIGYNDPKIGFDHKTCDIQIRIKKQSPDIAQGVEMSIEARQGKTDIYDTVGAGDQGMMFGYACTETPELMPLPITLAHNICRELSRARKYGEILYLRPDGKSQVTVEYIDGLPVRVDTVVVSTQHDETVEHDVIEEDIIEKVVKRIIPAKYLDEQTKYLINPTGKFVVGGPNGDSGLTGRKIIVDTYGGSCPHGGGAFSGKDPTKVDRSASYMLRYICKNLVAAGVAKKIQAQVSYAIGSSQPVSLNIDTFGTSRFTDEEIIGIINKVFNLRPGAIIDQLNLQKPIYSKTTNYGHFGKTNLPWEKVDKVYKIKELIAKSKPTALI